MDITLGFGPSVPGSSPGESTVIEKEIRLQRIFLKQYILTYAIKKIPTNKRRFYV